MPERRFTKPQLISWGVANRPEVMIGTMQFYCSPMEFDDPDPVVDDRLERMEDEGVRSRVFRAPDDGKLYQIEYDIGGSKTGFDGMDPPDMEGSFTGCEVERKEKTVFFYEVIEEEGKDEQGRRV